MENFSNLMDGFAIAFSFYHLALMTVGVLLGILVGVLPGLGAPNGVSLLLPLTFTMEPIAAIILLVAMISAIALTLRKRKDSKAIPPSEQVHVRSADRVRIVKMEATRAAPAAEAATEENKA